MYPCSDIEMIIAIKTIAGHFEKNITDLSSIRSNWTNEYATELIVRIDQIMDRYIGSDNKKEQRQATASVTDLHASAKRDLSFFKTQVKEDFRDNPTFCNETLKTLGFDKNLKDIQAGNQEAMSNLLLSFKNNMTDSLRQSITAKGMNVTLIDKIIGYTEVFLTASVSQEQKKSSSKINTQEATDALNGIYTEVIGICKYAASFYQDDKLRKDQFTFSKALAMLGGSNKPSSDNNTQETPAQ